MVIYSTNDVRNSRNKTCHCIAESKKLAAQGWD
jgi:hypothetical protein